MLSAELVLEAVDCGAFYETTAHVGFNCADMLQATDSDVGAAPCWINK